MPLPARQRCSSSRNAWRRISLHEVGRPVRSRAACLREQVRELTPSPETRRQGPGLTFKSSAKQHTEPAPWTVLVAAPREIDPRSRRQWPGVLGLAGRRQQWPLSEGA